MKNTVGSIAHGMKIGISLYFPDTRLFVTLYLYEIHDGNNLYLRKNNRKEQDT